MSNVDHLKNLINTKTRRWQKLKEEEALKGISTPPEVLIEIENLEAELQNLQVQLRQAGGTVESAPQRAPTPAGSSPRSIPTAQDSSGSGSGSKWWMAIVVALIGLGGVIFATVWNNPTLPVKPPHEEEIQPGEFEYSVRIETDMGESIPDAYVIIQVGGMAQLDNYTDSNGFTRIFIEGSYAEQPAILIVEKGGFHTHRQEINLRTDALPDLIRLEPAP